MKKLYTFNVKHYEEVEERKENEDGTVTLTKVRKDKEIPIVMRRPSTRELVEKELFYNIRLSKFIKKGINTKQMIFNAYRNAGGIESESEIKYIIDKAAEYDEKYNEYLKAAGEGKPVELIIEELKDLFVEVEKYKLKIQEIYQNSAETAADRETIIYLTLMFTLWEDEKPVFPGVSEESKFESYYEMFDDEEGFELEKKVFTKASIFWQFLYYQMGALNDKSLTETLIKDFDNLNEICENQSIIS